MLGKGLEALRLGAQQVFDRRHRELATESAAPPRVVERRHQNQRVHPALVREPRARRPDVAGPRVPGLEVAEGDAVDFVFNTLNAIIRRVRAPAMNQPILQLLHPILLQTVVGMPRVQLARYHLPTEVARDQRIVLVLRLPLSYHVLMLLMVLGRPLLRLWDARNHH